MSEKRDVLEFPLEELEIPQAITLMMQAAMNAHEHDQDTLERLHLLSEKLEARVEDAIDAAKAEANPTALADAMDETPVDEGDVFLMEENTILNYKGVLYALLCNEGVDRRDDGMITICIKKWNHADPRHEDQYGVLF